MMNANTCPHPMTTQPRRGDPAVHAHPRVLTRVVLAGAGGHDLISALDLDTGATTLLVPSEDGDLRRGLEGTRYPYGLIRLR